MSDPGRLSETVQLGEEYELDPRAYQLRRSGRALRLERIPMELLLLLVERPGELVTREQIVERIWGAGVALDTDNSINGAVRKLRQVLKDDPERPRFVQTLTGRGYRFIAPVIAPEAEEPRADAVRSEALSAVAKFVLRRWLVLVAIAIVLAALAAYFPWPRSRARSEPASGRMMLAVLPFENLTGDSAQDYFSDGLTEEMITQLGSLDPHRLGVIARTSVMRYKRSREPVERLGRELGVQYVLEGSVRRDAENVRITAQLIQVSDQTHLWAGKYDRTLNHLLTVQGEIAQAVADQIQLTLAREERLGTVHQPSLSPASYEAYDLYLKGRYSWNKRTAEGLREAVEYFRQSIAKDPHFARSYAGLADSYALMSSYSLAPQEEFIPKARAAALEALEIDETLPEAHTSLAVIAQDYDWDWQTAEKEYRRAIELDPNYATAHHWYAECLALEGRFDEAFPEIDRARQLDPLSLIIAADNGAILYYSHQYDRAIAQFRAVLEKEPNFPRAHMLVYAYAQKGMFAEAQADLEKWQHIEDTPWIQALRIYVYGRSGQPRLARHALEKLEESSRHQAMDVAPLFVAYLGLGRKEDALAWLQRAHLVHSPALTALKVDPLFDPLRDDPRFQDLLRRVGLAP